MNLSDAWVPAVQELAHALVLAVTLATLVYVHHVHGDIHKPHT